MKLSGSDYETVVRDFSWRAPERFNVAELCCTRQASGGLALVHEDRDGTVRQYTFGDIEDASNRFAHALEGLGVVAGNVVAIHLPQRPETVIAHMAIQKLGAIALPLFTLFGPDALRYRFADSGAVVLITASATLEALEGTLEGTDGVRHIVLVGAAGRVPEHIEQRPAHGFDALVDRAAPTPKRFDSRFTDPAFLLYTSGTTGNPKGVLHAQSVLCGHLPGIILPHEFFPQERDRFWTPADWAWAGGLFDCLLPAMYFGVPVVSSEGGKFDPHRALDFMARHDVRNSFIPPTALRMMQQSGATFAGATRTIASGGEKLGEGVIAWGQDTFGLTINEFYGQTEVNLVLGNCAALFDAKEGSMGRPIPGHEVAIVTPEGDVCPPGVAGVVAVKRPDPVMFIEYWNNPQATIDKFRGDWCLLGDVATMDEDGYFWFAGRDDDIIITSGYRVGPSEVEDCLIAHPAVALAGVVGTPDMLRGEVIAAFIQLTPGYTETAALLGDIQDFVRQRLASHEYPRIIHVIDAMPMTMTGKLRRRDLRKVAAEMREAQD